MLIVKTPLYLNLTSNPHTPPLQCKFGGGLCGCRVRGQGQKEWRLFDEKSDISVFLWLRDSTKFTLLSCAIRRAGCCTDYATACMPKYAREHCEFGGNPKAKKKTKRWMYSACSPYYSKMKPFEIPQMRFFSKQ